MSAHWFFDEPIPSRSAIENALRLAFWKSGYKQMWLSCTQDHLPYQCTGLFREEKFAIEWEPKNYLLLKMHEPNQDLLDAFQRVLKHSALAAYRNGTGVVVVEWRVKDAERRWQELQANGTPELQRLGPKT